MLLYAVGYTATAEMIPVTWPEVGNIHPFAPEDQWKGYRQMLDTLVSVGLYHTSLVAARHHTILACHLGRSVC